MGTGSEKPAAHTQQKSTPPPPNQVNFSNKFASCQLDLFVITLCLIWKVGEVFSNGSDKNVRWQESAHPGMGGGIKLTLPFGAP